MDSDDIRTTGAAGAAGAGGAAGPDANDAASDGGSSELRSALLIDWGGVLTTNLFDSFRTHCERLGIEPQTLRARFSGDPEGRELLIALEKGELAEAAFEVRLGAALGVAPEGLIHGLFAGVKADEAMLNAVQGARAAGVRTGLVSNSWGVHRYPHELFDELFDGVVISAEEGIRKPSRRMYELGAERAGADPAHCVYVDDLPFNLPPAQELGMATVHHTSAAQTLPQLGRLLGLTFA